jgi:hypothetical protein
MALACWSAYTPRTLVRDCDLGDNVACIHALIKVHDSHPCVRGPVEESLLYGAGPPVKGQQ